MSLYVGGNRFLWIDIELIWFRMSLYVGGNRFLWIDIVLILFRLSLYVAWNRCLVSFVLIQYVCNDFVL